MSKISDAYVVNGVIHNQIMDIIARNTLNRVDSCLVICADDEVFEQAMNTVINRYPQAIGVTVKADAGTVQQVYKSDIWIEHAGILPKEDTLLEESDLEEGGSEEESTEPNLIADPFPRAVAHRYRNRFMVMTQRVYDAADSADRDEWDALGVKHFIASTGGAY
jgi:hypothetical protein